MIEKVISKIKAEIKIVFDNVDAWFDVDKDLASYEPKNGGWNIN